MSLAQDVRYSWRTMRRSPGFVVGAVLTLAMGIAANTAVFSVMNGLILRPLNVPQAQSLYQSSARATRIQVSPIPTISILRLALGSSRKRTLRGLFTEAVLISLVGAQSAYGPAWRFAG